MNVLEAIEGRRSINFFDPDRKVDDATLKRLVEFALLSPSSANLQPWEIIAVTDPARKKILRQCSYNQPKVEEASAVFIIIANPGGLEENIKPMLESWAELGYIKSGDIENQKKIFMSKYGTKDSDERRIFAVKNASFMAMSIMIAAKGLGLDTHPMDGFDPVKLHAAFHIPEDRYVPLLIAVGYLRPGLELLPRAWRRSFEEVVRFNDFG